METEKHSWLKLSSTRFPYQRYDISVVIPSAAGRYESRWKWFWPQYISNTHPDIVKNTYIVCDEAEYESLTILCPEAQIMTAKPRFIVPKTIHGINAITTRLTFRLANDIAVIRKDWEVPILEQFNLEPKLQIISKVTHGVVEPEEQENMETDWHFIKEMYKDHKKATACVYTHGSILMAQTAVWRAYYSHVPCYTMHEHDEIYFSQIAQGDGIAITNMTGIDRFLCHVGITNKDFCPEWMEHVYSEVKKFGALEPITGFKSL